MHRVFLFISALIALLALLAGSPASAASLGVRDEAKFFSSDAISQAEQTINQINRKHSRDLLIETLPAIPQDKLANFQEQGKDKFFKQWVEARFLEQGVSGIYVLIVKNPAHLQVADGTATTQRLFTLADRDELSKLLLAAFRVKNYDQGLLSAVQFVQQRMDSHMPAGNRTGQTSSSGNIPATPPPPSNFPTNFPQRTTTGFSIGGLACIVIAVILFIVLIRGIFGRSGGAGRPGGNYPPQQGGYPQGGGYPPQGGYGPGFGGGGYQGGGGSGFGKGFLGGLLGGALGGYAENRFEHHGQNQPGGFAPPNSGGGAGGDSVPPDTGSNSTGGDFGPPDSGGGGGTDFGGSSDSGGGGGDFGGGGGGGDSGSSGGGDF